MENNGESVRRQGVLQFYKFKVALKSLKFLNIQKLVA